MKREGDFPCHLCGSPDLREVIDLGRLPASHHMRASLEQEERLYPVAFHYCNHCGLLQIRNPIPPDALYDTDTYSTGFQKPKHIDDLIITALSHRAPGPALDVGCNDGSLLDSLERHGFGPLAGIEPNRHAADLARRNAAHHIYTDYLTPQSAEALERRHGKFKLVTARHVLEHVCDIHNFFTALDLLLDKDGLFVMELPHVEAGFERGNPVILWEEHVNYFTEGCVEAMLEHFGFTVLERRYYAFGGGSIAFVAQRAAPRALDVKAARTFPLSYYRRYNDRIYTLKLSLNALIARAKSAGYDIALYGAAPRSCTLVNFVTCGKEIDHVIDDRPDIQGRYMPGTEHAIATLDATVFTGRPLLVLLGVGAENEHKVLGKLESKLGYVPVAVSLFPPRDIYASIAAASAHVEHTTFKKTA